MKKVYIGFVVLFSIFAIMLGISLYSNNSIPGDMLYNLDKSFEHVQKNLAQLSGKTSLAYFHLDLAKERLDEVKEYQKQSISTSQLLFQSYAQTTEQNTDATIKLLLEEFNNELQTLTKLFEELKNSNNPQSLEIAQEIAQKTTEFGNVMTDLVDELDTEELNVVDDSIDILEELDDDAVEELVSSEEDDDEIRGLSMEKVKKKVMKANEKLTDLKDKYDDKSKDKKLTAQQITEVGAVINQIKGMVLEAQVALDTGNLNTAYTKAKEALDLTAKTKDMLESELEDDGIENETEDIEDDKNDDSKNNEDNNDDLNDDKKDNTESERDSDNKSTSQNKNEDTKSKDDDKEVEVEVEEDGDDSNDDENEEEDDDVKGITDSNTSKYWLKLTF